MNPVKICIYIDLTDWKPWPKWNRQKLTEEEKQEGKTYFLAQWLFIGITGSRWT